MEIRIIEEGKDFIKLELVAEDHTLANALKNELENDSHVKVAGYTKEHPLVSNPILMVKTDGKESSRKALDASVDRLKKKNSAFLAQIKKLK